MMFSILTFLALSAPASAAAPASCMGKTGTELQVCNEQRAAAQAAEIAATKRRLAELEATCSQVCTDAPAAPATTAPKKASGPSRTYLVLDAYGKHIKKLEVLVRDGVVSDRELEIELTAINTKIAEIGATLADHEARIKALEDAEPTITAPPMLIEGPVGPQGPAGANGRNGRDGRDGRDGLPAEIAVMVGVDGIHSSEWSIVGGEVTIQVGGRLTDKLRLGGYGNGFIAGANDLGFGAGGYLGYEVTYWFRPSVTLGWREVGLDIATDGARRSFQGLEATVNLEFNPTGKLVVGVHGGAFLEEDPAFVWGIDTGFRF